MDLLVRRRAEVSGECVFPGQGICGCIVDPTRVIARVTELSQVSFRVHDLRRTFATIAESLDIPAYALKRLLNHSGAGDVTAGYTIITTNRLRKPMEVIATYLLKAMGVEPIADIVTLESSHATR
jgi:integrase